MRSVRLLNPAEAARLPQRRTPLRVVIFRTGQMGDTVCAVPAFRLLRSHFREASLTLLCDAAAPGHVAASEIIGRLDIFDGIVSYRAMRGWHTWLEVFRIMRRLQPDILVQLPQANKPAKTMKMQRLFFRLSGVRRLYGFRPHACAAEWRPNEPLRLVRVLNDEGFAGEKPEYALPVDENAASSVREKMRTLGIEDAAPYVVFCGGGKTPAQRWPLDRYAVALKRLSRVTGLPVVAVGSPADARAYESEIIPRFPDIRIIGAALTMAELAALLADATCYVGNDTGPMHLAAAMGCPVVAVISARNRPGQWDPDVRRRVLIRHRTECEGCRLTACGEKGHRCMEAISADDVVARMVPFVKSLAASRQVAVLAT